MISGNKGKNVREYEVKGDLMEIWWGQVEMVHENMEQCGTVNHNLGVWKGRGKSQLTYGNAYGQGNFAKFQKHRPSLLKKNLAQNSFLWF